MGDASVVAFYRTLKRCLSFFGVLYLVACLSYVFYFCYFARDRVLIISIFLTAVVNMAVAVLATGPAFQLVCSSIFPAVAMWLIMPPVLQYLHHENMRHIRSTSKKKRKKKTETRTTENQLERYSQPEEDIFSPDKRSHQGSRLMSMLSAPSYFLRGKPKTRDDGAMMSAAGEAGAVSPDYIDERLEMVRDNEDRRGEPGEFQHHRPLPEIVGQDWPAEDSVESAILFHKEVNNGTMGAIAESEPLEPSKLSKVPLRPRRKEARNNLAEDPFAAGDGAASEDDDDDEPDNSPKRPIRSAKQRQGRKDKQSEGLSTAGGSGAAMDEQTKWAVTKGRPDATNPLLRGSGNTPDNSRFQVVVAAYDHVAEARGELQFLEGDEIEIICKHDGDWWEGENSRTGEKGIFPVSYTKVPSTSAL